MYSKAHFFSGLSAEIGHVEPNTMSVFIIAFVSQKLYFESQDLQKESKILTSSPLILEKG